MGWSPETILHMAAKIRSSGYSNLCPGAAMRSGMCLAIFGQIWRKRFCMSDHCMLAPHHPGLACLAPSTGMRPPTCPAIPPIRLLRPHAPPAWRRDEHPSRPGMACGADRFRGLHHLGRLDARPAGKARGRLRGRHACGQSGRSMLHRLPCMGPALGDIRFSRNPPASATRAARDAAIAAVAELPHRAGRARPAMAPPRCPLSSA